ncbi:DMT family transporter, partial [Pseudomonadota bacterium]
MSNTLVRDVSLLFVLAMMWSSSFTAIKIGANDLPPATFAMLRVAVAAFVLLVWVKLRRIPLPTKPKLWGAFFLIGLFGNVIPFVLINWGEQKIASGLAAIIIATMPLAALLLGRIFSDEVLNLRRGVGVTLG